MEPGGHILYMPSGLPPLLGGLQGAVPTRPDPVGPVPLLAGALARRVAGRPTAHEAHADRAGGAADHARPDTAAPVDAGRRSDSASRRAPLPQHTEPKRDGADHLVHHVHVIRRGHKQQHRQHHRHRRGGQGQARAQ